MAEPEKFSINKFLDFSPHAWYKVGGLGFKVLVVILIVLGIKFTFDRIFPPPPANVNQPHISVESGGTSNYTVIQKSEKKREWWLPFPFVEIFGEMKDNGDKNTGARFGGRWEF